MLSYIGSKVESGKWIREFIPTNIKNYVEVFGGMFKTFFNMDLEKYSNLKQVVYSDFNPVNSNLFACVKDHQRLLYEVNKIPYTLKDEYTKGERSEWYFRYMFKEFQRLVFNKEYDLANPSYEDAARYAFILSNSYSGLNPEHGAFVDSKGNQTSKFSAFINKLNSKVYQDYFNRITDVENLDFNDCLDKYDVEGAFFYLDPPYFNMEHYYSNHCFNLKSHKVLANKLKTLKAKWILSYYYFEDLEKWFPMDKYFWFKKTFARPSSSIKGATGEEIIILNYKPQYVPDGTVCMSEDKIKNLAA